MVGWETRFSNILDIEDEEADPQDETALQGVGGAREHH